MMRQLVFVHGRSQQGKDALALKAEWIASLESGLAKSGLRLPIPEPDVRFPYYGQTLYDLVSGADQPADVVIRGATADAEEEAFVKAVLQETARKEGITDDDVRTALGAQVVQRGPLNWEWLQGILKVIDRHVPFGSGASVALFTRDVYQYLKNPGIRDRIEAGVRQALRPGVETVVVSHSLGTVVAYNLLRREGKQNGWVVPLFVTLGSPLGVTAIKNALKPIKHPECASKWFNAMDERDVVALYPLDSNGFGVSPAIENKTDVRNHTDNRHGIAGYLDDEVVAKKIYDSLKA